MKLKVWIISIVSVLVIALTGILLYCFWPAIKGTIDKSKYYTEEDVTEAYEKGYEDGCKSEEELTGQVNYYKSLVDEYYIQVNTLNEEIANLTSKNGEYEKQVNDLKSEKTTLNARVSELEQQNTQNTQTIQENETTISNLQSEVAEKEKTIQNNTSEIENLKQLNSELQNDKTANEQTIQENNNKIKQLESANSNLQSELEKSKSTITSLQTVNKQLEEINNSNSETISNLNNQIVSLNQKIIELSQSVQSNSSIVSALNARIAELEKSVQIYEKYLDELEVGEQVVATFEFNGSVIYVQILNKGGKILFPTPDSTEKVIFNYWTVNGEKVNSTDNYTINKNTKFIADVTLKYEVKFISDGREYDIKQLVIKGEKASIPSSPSKVGYDFDYWTIDGISQVDISNYPINVDTTFIAKFTKLYTVTFKYETETKSTQQVRSGEHALNVEVESTKYKVFNGWSIGGVIYDLSTYFIYDDTEFIADLTYFYDVKFMVDGSQFGDVQLIIKNGFASLPGLPSKDGFVFECWTINGNDAVDVSSYAIVNTTNFIAKFKKLTPFSEISWSEMSLISNDISEKNMTSQEVFKEYSWSIGDEKDIELTSAEVITVLILGFNHDDKSDGSGKVGISIGMKNCLTTRYQMNSTAITVGGWDNSRMRTVVMNDLFLLLPSDLQNVIKSVNKSSTAGSKSKDIVVSEDKLWLPSLAEIASEKCLKELATGLLGRNGKYVLNEGHQYEYYRNLFGDTDISDVPIHYLLEKHLSNGSDQSTFYGWWLRSPDLYYNDCFYFIDGYGEASSNISYSPMGVSFGFCI